MLVLLLSIDLLVSCHRVANNTFYSYLSDVFNNCSAIVLFSGLGPIEGVQNAVKVGVGALAGSTIMLLTIPWFMSILAGQVPIENGKPIYSKRKRAALEKVRGNRGTCCSHGVDSASVVKTNGMIMAMTLLAYIIVQIPGNTLHILTAI